MGAGGGMSRDIVLFDKGPIDGTAGAPAVLLTQSLQFW